MCGFTRSAANPDAPVVLDGAQVFVVTEHDPRAVERLQSRLSAGHAHLAELVAPVVLVGVFTTQAAAEQCALDFGGDDWREADARGVWYEIEDWTVNHRRPIGFSRSAHVRGEG